jgi:hypothetical protein
LLTRILIKAIDEGKKGSNEELEFERMAQLLYLIGCNGDPR